jgi:hypothetical protein
VTNRAPPRSKAEGDEAGDQVVGQGGAVGPLAQSDAELLELVGLAVRDLLLALPQPALGHEHEGHGRGA